MQELSMNEIDQVNGGKLGFSLLGFTAQADLTEEGLSLNADFLGFTLVGLQLPQ